MVAVRFRQPTSLRLYLEPFLNDIQPNCRTDDEINEAESRKKNRQTGENDRGWLSRPRA
jgi:hypothetical protein